MARETAVLDALAEEVARTPATPSRGPAPEFVPNTNPEVNLPTDHPLYLRMLDLRQQAWDRGIDENQMRAFEIGGCEAQTKAQILALEDWLTANPA